MIALITFILMAASIYCFIGIIKATNNLKKVDYAQAVLKKLYDYYQNDLISDVQARVFLNDMTDPLDTVSISQVNEELNRIKNEAKNSDRSLSS